jgi:hypothetical protein
MPYKSPTKMEATKPSHNARLPRVTLVQNPTMHNPRASTVVEPSFEGLFGHYDRPNSQTFLIGL